MPLTDEQIDRYSRQIILPEVGGRGQEALLAAHVVLAGEGPLSEWVARYLVAAGVGKLSLALPAASDFLTSLTCLNPDCRVEGTAPSSPSFALAGWMAAKRDPPQVAVVGGCKDEAAFGLVDHCWMAGVPLIAARVRDGDGELTALQSSHPSSPCPSCAGVGRAVSGPPGGSKGSASANRSALQGRAWSPAPFIATLAVTEVLKLILGVGKPLFGRRLRYYPEAQTVVEESLTGCSHRSDTGAA